MPNVENCSEIIVKVSTERARVLNNDTEITSTDGQGSHVGGVLVVNKTIFSQRIYINIEFCSQRREMLLFLGNFDNEVIEKED